MKTIQKKHKRIERSTVYEKKSANKCGEEENERRCKAFGSGKNRLCMVCLHCMLDCGILQTAKSY